MKNVGAKLTDEKPTQKNEWMERIMMSGKVDEGEDASIISSKWNRFCFDSNISSITCLTFRPASQSISNQTFSTESSLVRFDVVVRSIPKHN